VNQIPLGHIRCQFEGRSYAPITLASYLHQSGIVQTLLSFGASVNVANREHYLGFVACALNAIIPSRDEIPTGKVQGPVQNIPEITQTVKLLLANGAEANIPQVKNAIHF
jgi:hypothetical protein